LDYTGDILPAEDEKIQKIILPGKDYGWRRGFRHRCMAGGKSSSPAGGSNSQLTGQAAACLALT